MAGVEGGGDRDTQGRKGSSDDSSKSEDMREEAVRFSGRGSFSYPSHHRFFSPPLNGEWWSPFPIEGVKPDPESM